MKVYIHYDKYDEDDDESDDGYISVSEIVPSTHSTPPRNDDIALWDASLFSPMWDEDDNEDEELPTYSEPTLRIDMKSIFVLDIKSVQYEYHSLKVSRHRRVKSEGV